MNHLDLQSNINLGETLTVEFKSSFTKEVIETLVAFANAKGGSVLIGVADDKKIVGVSTSDESLKNWINEIKQNTFPQIIPDVFIFALDQKKIVVMSCCEYPIKPIAFKNKYFKRIANSNHLMRIDEITNEHLKTINSSWDFYLDPNHEIEVISIEKVKTFMGFIEQRSGSKIDLLPLDFLSKLEIIRNGKPTFGAFLLFANDYCAISDVQIGRFKSDINIIDSLSLNTDLFSEADQIISFIKKHLMVEYIITGEPKNEQRYDYPLEAVREIVINMLVHRDYRNSSSSTIKIFDDRIEFYNPGKLIGNITVKDLLTNNYTSQSRNKLIAKAFKEVGLIERFGSGINRILTMCENFGIISPNVEEIFDGFRIILFKKKVKNYSNDVVYKTPNVAEELSNAADYSNFVVEELVNVVDYSPFVADKRPNVVDKKRNVAEESKNVSSISKIFADDRLSLILDLILGNNSISANQLANHLRINSRTAQRDLDKLKKLKRIKRVGAEKTGYWEILM